MDREFDNEMADYIGISHRSIKSTYKNSSKQKYKNIYKLLCFAYSVVRSGVPLNDVLEIVELLKNEDFTIRGIKDLMEYKNNLYKLS